jgi:hypothetical protein
MRRIVALLAAVVLTLSVAASASAHGAGRNIYPPKAHIHGHSMAELATAWTAWAWSTTGADNPVLAGVCEPSPIDPRIWFMPIGLTADDHVSCTVPKGTIVFASPGGYECSFGEGNGSTATELRACSEPGAELITKVEVSLDGRAPRHLDRYLRTTGVIQLGSPNFWTATAGPSLETGYFLASKPLHRGHHTLWLYDEFESFDLQFGITIDITVGP